LREQDLEGHAMEVDRRSFVQSALAAGAVGSVGAAEKGQLAQSSVIAQPTQVAPDLRVIPPPSGMRFDIIIVGGGTIGLSAAYYAAARGLKTLLLEQYDQFADPRASSSGHSRFFRIMHSSAYMAELAESALALWHEIETASQRRILKPQPLIFYGVSGPTPEGNLGEMERALSKLGVPYQHYDSGQSLRNAFPAFRDVPDKYTALVQPNSAVIRTRESITAFHKLATTEGATLLTNQRAAVAPRKGVYQVTCPAGTSSHPI
jgi:sarcosine oxidase / L-pipecolate oxidase